MLPKFAAPTVTGYERGGRQREVYTAADVEYVFCPLCGSKEHTRIYKERAVLGIVRCRGCDLLYVNPRLKSPEKIYWGDADKYLNEARMIFEGKAQHHRDPNYRADLKVIYKYKPSGKLLDVGTNMGFFLRLARNKSWSLYGVEPAPALAEIARKYFGLNVKTAFLQDAGFPESFFDVVSMSDVFEHLPNPGEVLSEVRRILKPDGIVFIKVPNARYNLLKFYLARITGSLKDYDLFDSYEHIVHYSDKTLRGVLDRFGLTVIKISVAPAVQLPAWHKYVGSYYHYPSPWYLDAKRYWGRILFYWLGRLEYLIFAGRIGYFAPNIAVIARKKK
jgi:SAM-dependent methyltransferase